MKQSTCKHRAGQPKINTKDRGQLCHFICSRMLSVFPGYSMLKKWFKISTPLMDWIGYILDYYYHESTRAEMLTTRMGVKVEWVYPVPVQWKLRPQIRTDSETELSAFRQSFGCYVYAVFVHICDAWICHDKYMYYSVVFCKKFLAELIIDVRRNSKKITSTARNTQIPVKTL